ncbi:MAG: exodeoxyribonuclease III [Pseudomonadales bacterium]
MNFISFNTNSIRMRAHQLEALIERHDPEIIGIQETKVTDEEFPVDMVRNLGYHAEFYGQKTHYGVALLSKQAPITVTKGLPAEAEDAQRRLITGTYDLQGHGPVTIINGYFPQGEARNHPTKFPAKAAFYRGLIALLKTQHSPQDNLIVMGDMNVAPVDLDIGIGIDNQKRWLRDGKTSFLPEEREWLRELIDWGLTDTYRALHPEIDDRFSWFDYRSKGFEREPKRGLRIDLILASEPLINQLNDAGIDYEARAMDKPSDHCPIWAGFD